MRWSTFFFAFGLAMFLPCFLAVAAIPMHWVVVETLYLSLLGLGFGVGMLLPLGLDLVIAWSDAQARIWMDEARARALDVETTIRKARLSIEVAAPAAAVHTQPADYWRTSAHLFLTAANEYGFAIRVLVGKQVVTWEDWGRMVDCLTAAGVMVARPRAGWAEGWSWERWRRERLMVALPHPEGAAPEVLLTPTTTTHNEPQQAETA